MNRGIARRVVFEEEREMRVFLALLARQVRCRRIEVHAFCLMGTHFHLLLRSPKGELAEAMRQVENVYVRWFNRRHGRDGALFRGRYLAKLVDGLGYRRILTRYIDENPVAAGVVPHPRHYPFGSAWVWHNGAPRPWLSRCWIGAEIAPERGAGHPTPEAYDRVFGRPLANEHLRWLELRQRGGHDREAYAVFAAGAPDRVRAWMVQRARVADGSRPGCPVVGADSVHAVIEADSLALQKIRIGPQRSRDGAAGVLETALLRDLCGMSWREVAHRLGISIGAARNHYRLHRVAITLDCRYAAAAAAVAHLAARRFLGAEVDREELP